MSYRYSMLADHSYYQYQPYQAHHISNVVNNDNMRPYYTVCHVLCTSNSNTIYAIYIYICVDLCIITEGTMQGQKSIIWELD